MDQVNEMNNVLGYGKIFKVLVGRTDDGQPDIKEYHVTPVAIKDLSNLFDTFDKYMAVCGDKNKEYGKKYALEIIYKGLLKMHPDVTKDEIEKVFGLVAIAEVINIVIELNDFFLKVQEMNKKADQAMEETEKMIADQKQV